MAEYFGIDVSLYQKGFDFAAAKAEGVKFVIIKASEGNFSDPEFASHYEKAGKAGLYRGAYHYLTAVSVQGAKAEADVFLKTVSGKKFEYPLFVDVEEKSMTKLSATDADGVVKAFCDKVEAAGYWCGFYCNYNFYKNVIGGEALAKRYSLWLASWSGSAPAPCQIWQFGGEVNVKRKNSVAGVVCDQNYSYRDFPALIAEKGLNGFKKAVADGGKSTSATKSDKGNTTEAVKGEDAKNGVSSGSKSNVSGSSKSDTSNGSKKVFKAGDEVKLSKDAVIWGTSEKFASWVYRSKLYLRELVGSRAVVSTLKSGAVTGAVDVKYLVKGWL